MVDDENEYMETPYIEDSDEASQVQVAEDYAANEHEQRVKAEKALDKAQAVINALRREFRNNGMRTGAHWMKRLIELSED